MAIAVNNFPRTPVNYASEFIRLNGLMLKETALTDSGILNFTSLSSQREYNSSTGEVGLLELFFQEQPLRQSILFAEDINSILEEIDLISSGTDIPTSLSPTTPTVSTTETIVSAPLKATITGETTVVSGGLVSTNFVEVSTQNNATTPTSESYINLGNNPLGSVPSGTKDSYDTDTDIFTARTKVGKDKTHPSIKRSDVSIVGSDTGTVVRYGVVLQPSDYKNNVIVDDNNLFFAGYDKSLFENRTTSGSIGTYYVSSFELATWVFATGTTLSQAQDELEGTQFNYELATPSTRKLGINSQALSFPDFTQVSINDGVVRNELTNPVLAANFYRFNDPNRADSASEFLVESIQEIKYNGRDILGLGTLGSGGIWWFVSETVVEENHIDLTKIRVNYTTSETNDQASATGTFSNSLAQAQADEAVKLAGVGNNVDELTGRFNNSIGNLGLSDLNGFSVTSGGLTSWTNPTDLVRVEIYQSEFDISDYNYEQLNNISDITKYNVGTGTNQQLIIQATTLYHVVPVAIYTDGGKEYRKIGNSIVFTTANNQLLYDNGTSNVPFTGGDQQVDRIRLQFQGSTSTTDLYDLSPYTTVRAEVSQAIGFSGNYTVGLEITNESGTSIIASENVGFSDSDTVHKDVEVDVASINSGKIRVRFVGRGSESELIDVYEVEVMA